MSGRAPYGPSLLRFTDCVCDVLPMKKVVGVNEAADKCSTHYERGIDPRTVDRYVTQHLNELNKKINKKCGKKVTEECARKGFKITESISGALRDQRKTPISAHQSPRGLPNVEQESVCATELGAESNGRRQDFLPPSFSREISSELKLLSRRTEINSHLHSNKRSQLPLVV